MEMPCSGEPHASSRPSEWKQEAHAVAQHIHSVVPPIHCVSQCLPGILAHRRWDVVVEAMQPTKRSPAEVEEAARALWALYGTAVEIARQRLNARIVAMRETSAPEPGAENAPAGAAAAQGAKPEGAGAEGAAAGGAGAPAGTDGFDKWELQLLEELNKVGVRAYVRVRVRGGALMEECVGHGESCRRWAVGPVLYGNQVAASP